jgi:phospholipase/carboxylesterase
VAARGQDLGGLQAGLAAGLPDVAITAPDAPFVHDDNPALGQWHSLTGVTRANRPARVAAARGALDTLLRSQIAEQGFAGRLDRVALVGFSQGATMVFDAIASGRWPVAAAVTFACSVTRPDPVAPPPGTKMLMVHGSADRAVPPGNSATGRTLLRRHGLDAHHLVCAGVGYESGPAATVYAARFIGSALRAKS